MLGSALRTCTIQPDGRDSARPSEHRIRYALNVHQRASSRHRRSLITSSLILSAVPMDSLTRTTCRLYARTATTSRVKETRRRLTSGEGDGLTEGGRGSKSLGGIRSRPRPAKNSHNVKILKILGNVENCNSCMSEAVHVSPSYA